ncbi:MAG: WbqC family protein [Candidatus Cloacimonetes bacterium]|jgi:hypothetical protein|nr:WbqC family protein [Candidatus Cloacimonadota bacterium]MBT6993793.1 WbqC family protein [Candidatus Cloacimonadota bacterium]MBT7470177.1 WbqC family protein [Candidatus Cloacimonadota bacterium]
MKKVAILQSNYIPWKGYFHLIQKADHFVFLDNVQYTTRDWRNRNRIKTPSGSKWLTIPTNGNKKMMINEVTFINSSWIDKHLKSIRLNYSKTPFFQYYYSKIKAEYLSKKWENLSKLNQHLIKFISNELGIKTKFYNATDFINATGKNERLISIIKQLQCDYYITGPAAKDYLNTKLFADNGITIEIIDYSKYIPYVQPFGKFEHDVSVLDLLFCVGKNATNYIWRSNENSI